MKKRHVSLLLIFTLICTMFAPALTVSAANSMTELSDYWSAFYATTASSADKLAEISTSQHYTGASSLHIKKVANNNHFYVQNLSDALEAGAMYDVEFYVYNNSTTEIPDSARVYLTTKIKNFTEATVTDTEKTGWKKYSFSIEGAVDTTSGTYGWGSAFWFQFNNACAVDMYIDDVKVVKQGTDINVVKDGGFEGGFTSLDSIPEIDGYTVQYINPGDNSKLTTQPTATYEVAVKSDASYDANGASLYIKRAGNYTEQVRQTKLISTEATAYTVGTNYTLTFYTDKQFDTYAANRSYFYLGTGSAVWIRQMTCEPQSNGWYKYSYTQAAANNTPLQFIFRGGMDMHIDEMSVVDADTGANKTPSGTFGEGTGEVEPETPAAVSYKAYEPKSVILHSYKRIHSGDTTMMPVMLSWENPNGDVEITDISIYDVTSGTPAEISIANISKAGKAVNAHLLGSYITTKVHTFRLAFTFADGETTSVEAAIKPENVASSNVASLGNVEGSGWLKYYQNQSSLNQHYMLPADITIDSSVYYGDGESGKSMHIVANKAPDASATRASDFSTTNTANYFVRAYYMKNAQVGLASTEVGSTYRIKFYAKGDLTTAADGAVNLKIQGSTGGAFSTHTPFASYVGKTIDNWTQFTAEFTPTTAFDFCMLYFEVTSAVSDLWIDNIECYKVVNGTETGENLVTAGSGFCSTFDNPGSVAVDVSSISATASSGMATINYNAGSATKIYIYEKAVENDVEVLKLRAIADPNATQITINGLTNGETYEFVYVTQNNRYVLSEPKTIGTVTPDAPALDVTSYKLYDSTSEVADITAKGDYTVKISLTNNKEASLDATLILALCNGTEIVTIVEDPQTITLGNTGDFEATVTVPQSDDYTVYTIKAFLWDSLDDMKPLNVSCEF